jgi:hypothetical protein
MKNQVPWFWFPVLANNQEIRTGFKPLEGVAGRPSAELLATFFDNILKKGGSKKLSDKAIEETLGKILLTRDELF